MANIELEVKPRTEFGKSAARHMRREGFIPATIYAAGKDPICIQIEEQELTRALRTMNAVYSLTVDKKTHLAVVKDVQRNPVKQTIDHVDFYEVKEGQTIRVVVPIVKVGEIKGNGIPVIERHTVVADARVGALPEKFVLSVDGMREGAKICAKDIELPEGARLVNIRPNDIIIAVRTK